MVTILDSGAIDAEYSLQDLIIPQQVLKPLNFELEESQRKGRPFRNTLALSGTGGSGKTSLNMAIARQIRATRVVLVAAKPSSKEVKEIQEAIIDTYANVDEENPEQPYCVLLLDEIHAYANQPWLLDTTYGARGLIRDGRRIQFTVLAGTTNRGQMPQTLFSRFPIKLHLHYTDEEFDLILDRVAERFGVVLDPEGKKVLRRAANGNPRTAETILGFWGLGDPREAVLYAQLQPDGLDHEMLRLLQYLEENRQSRDAIGRSTLARAIEAPGGIDDLEAVLLRRRYIRHLPQGIQITPNGIKRVQTFLKDQGAMR